ncbi:hypothetical protein [Kocuria sp. NPDC057446]|uniref:hypothetical protein n=1 Tax=Kocuria sp. NPDC057446 TaxID=3346137 RepID=UPI00367E0A6C
MAEEVIRDLSVRWITSRIEYAANTSDLERFFFEASDKNSYYIDLNKTNVASEIAAINLTRDAFLHNKKVNIWYEVRDNRRWVKALNLHH